jgi:branched-chain amino acid transport system permease protein
MAPADKATLLPHLPAWLTDAHLDFWLAAPLTLATMGVLALLIGIPLVRLSGSAAAIATLGLLIITNVVLAGAKDFTNGASTFFGVPPITTIGLTFGWTAVALVVARLFRESVPGLRLRASREDELASRSSAVDVTRVRLLAWVIGAVIASGAGILLAHYLTAFSPRQFYLAETFNVLAMLIVGGSASVSGAVSGALAVTVAFEVLRRIEDSTGIFGLTGIFVGLLILVALFRRREGLVGHLEIDERIMGRWRVRRPRIETPPPA